MRLGCLSIVVAVALAVVLPLIVDVGVCYVLARPVEGVGIVMPALAPAAPNGLARL